MELLSSSTATDWPRFRYVRPNSKTKSGIKCSNGYFLTKWFKDKYLVKYYLNPISGCSAMQDQVADGRSSVYGLRTANLQTAAAVTLKS